MQLNHLIIFFSVDLTEVPNNIFTKIIRTEDTIAALSKFISLQNIAKYLLQEGFIGQYEFTCLTHDLADTNTLIQILQKAGGDRKKVERFYYCLMKSYEDGGPISHKEYARHWRYCGKTRVGVYIYIYIYIFVYAFYNV